MATWAIGDVHGCFRTLEALIRRLDLDVRRDRLWMVGDLVNRGPGSLDVLRWARALDDEMGNRFQVVLGNHDLHLIARGLGIARARSDDTLEDVLNATDGPDLVDWLRHRPFVHIGQIGDADFVLVHAGLQPGWSPRDALAAGRSLEGELRGSNAVHLLRRQNPDEPGSGTTKHEARRNTSPESDSQAVSRGALTTLTRMRMVDSEARPHRFNGPPEEAPEGLQPWFDVEPRGCPDHAVVCGHWAALGLHLRPHLIALDTGCVWGGRLSAVRLDDRRVVQERMADRL